MVQPQKHMNKFIKVINNILHILQFRTIDRMSENCTIHLVLCRMLYNIKIATFVHQPIEMPTIAGNYILFNTETSDKNEIFTFTNF